MKNQNCHNRFSIFERKTCITNDLLKSKLELDIKKGIPDNETKTVLKYKLNHPLIDIDTIFAN